MKIIVIDGDYTFNRLNQPVVRLFGKNVENNEDIVLHIIGFKPYFYIDNCGLNIFELQKWVEKIAKGYIESCEIIKKFKPVGYQIEKSNMLKLTLFNPKNVPELRTLLKKNISELTDSRIYEADIVFINRFLVDNEINGMDVIQFDEKGKELENYGLQCNRLFICTAKDIHVLRNEIINIEY